MNNLTSYAPAPGGDIPSFLDQLIALRRSHIEYDNRELDEVIQQILDEASLQPCNLINNLKDGLRLQVSDAPERQSHSVIYTVDMSSLLSQTRPLSVWYQDIDSNGDTRLSKIPINNILTSVNCDIIYRYLLHVNPRIQQLRNNLRSSFPDANIIPILDCRTGLKLDIGIVYKLPVNNIHEPLVNTISSDDDSILFQW
jgi:hypothetical protein